MLKPTYSVSQIADYLENGYWTYVGEQPHHAASHTLTFNIDGLTAAGRALALTALQTWQDVCDVTFVQTSGSAFITFDDNQSGAFTSDRFIGSSTTSASVNISTDWLNYYGTAIGSYSLQTYIHEIGHALGLGHAGPYNGSASYSSDTLLQGDNLYLDDTWQSSVMSYFAQPSWAAGGASYRFVSTPMLSDIAAVEALYGPSADTRIGDTVYGFHSNAGTLYDFGWYRQLLQSAPAMTIVDGGGSDTLDLSGYGSTNSVDLTPGSISSVGGLSGNISIDSSTIIENVIGGSGTDTVIGNSADNSLSGGGGNDSLSGGSGNDTLDGGAGADGMSGGFGDDTYVVDNAGDAVTEGLGAGTDTVVSTIGLTVPANVENLTLTGSAAVGGTGDGGANVLTAFGGNKTLFGLGGNDTVQAFGSGNVLVGGDGSDAVGINGTSNFLDGGAGNDFVGVTGSTNDLVGGAGADSIFDIGDGNTLEGGTENDNLQAFGSGNVLTGGDGSDAVGINGDGNTLRGGLGDDFVGVTGNRNDLAGEAGNDNVVEFGNGNTLDGGDDNDVLQAFGTGNVLMGGAGADGVGIAGDSNFLRGGDGADFVGVTGNLNDLKGEAGDDTILVVGSGNTLDGGAGADTLTVQAGSGSNNFLTGGADADRFVFGAGVGLETVTDFSEAQGDAIELHGYAGVASFADLQPHLSQAGADVRIDLGADHILLQATTLAQIHAQDFLFA